MKELLRWRFLQQLQYASTGVTQRFTTPNQNEKSSEKCDWHLHEKATLALENVCAVLFLGDDKED